MRIKGFPVARRFVLFGIAASGLLVASPWIVPASLRAMVDTTVYAPGYRESAFRSIRVGMARREVLQLLGEPLYGYNLNGRYVLRYSDSSCGDSCYKRLVILDRGERVVDVVSEFYWE